MAGHGKRAHADGDETLVGEEAPNKRTKTIQDAPDQSNPRKRSSEFYYPDGNIIVIVEGVEHNLHFSRLKKHCDFFARLWDDSEESADEDAEEDEEQDDAQPTSPLSDPDADVEQHVKREDSSVLDDEPDDAMEEVASSSGEAIQELQGIRVADFTEFLRAFENPLMYMVTLPNQSVAVPLLRVAHHLGCQAIFQAAKHRLSQLYPSTIPGRTSRKKTLDHASTIITVAREFHLPELSKRAFYEVLRNAHFWKVVITNRASVNLTDADILNLYHARQVLQQEWRTLLNTPPEAACIAAADQRHCIYSSRSQRAAHWRSHFVDSGELEKGAEDPICSIDTVLQSAFFQQPVNWCKACLDGRRDAFEAAKVRWWGMLDQLFKIEMPANAAPAE